MRQQAANFVLDRLSQGRLSVFLFHKVPVQADPLAPDEIDLKSLSTLLDLLLDNFRILPLAEAVALLKKGKLPARTACITFDDGYSDWRPGVAELLLSRGVPATFFVCTGQFGGVPMWNERILHVVRSARVGTRFNVGDAIPAFRLESEEDRLPLAASLQKLTKYQPFAQRDRILIGLEEAAGVSAKDAQMMSTDDLRFLHSKGFEIGAHTKNHPILNCCDLGTAAHEIHACREELEGLTRGQVTSFAYPNGRPAKDFNSDHIRIVRHAGFHRALTTGWGTAQPETSLFQLPRFTPWGPTPLRTYAQLFRNFLAPVKELAEQDE